MEVEEEDGGEYRESNHVDEEEEESVFWVDLDSSRRSELNLSSSSSFPLDRNLDIRLNCFP